MLYRVVRKPSEFVYWFNVPKKGTYTRGRLFDSAGEIFGYNGEASSLMVSGRLHTLLENIVLPSLVFKVMSFGVYFGPKAVNQEGRVSLDEFKDEMIREVSQYESRADVDQLTRELGVAGASHADKIAAIRKWIHDSATKEY